MKKEITDEIRESIVVEKLFFGNDTKEICEKHKLSNTFVSATVAGYKAVEAQDWDRVRFMLRGKQMTLQTLVWAAGRLNVQIPSSFFETEEEPAPPAPPQLEGQMKMEDFKTLKLDKGTNNTVHALIDALQKNTAEMALLRKAVMALLNSTAMVD